EDVLAVLIVGVIAGDILVRVGAVGAPHVAAPLAGLVRPGGLLVDGVVVVETAGGGESERIGAAGLVGAVAVALVIGDAEAQVGDPPRTDVEAEIKSDTLLSTEIDDTHAARTSLTCSCRPSGGTKFVRSLYRP